MKPKTAGGYRMVVLPQFTDLRGSLGVIESGKEIGFVVRRVYFMYGHQLGAARGAHAHRSLEQLVVALAGRFEVLVDDGRRRAEYRLAGPDRALYLGPMVWREMRNFSADSICLVLASHSYDEDDYCRDYDGFLREARGDDW
ncbi:sugar 3,4-ketoisomerase [Actinosynnema sp. CS-041913]|uniref:sugar 3,4-ketoisomerase n=1 Tax=Actinosynnema sp. CS-041913 TaxID=3239917 RepID=UPI003D8FC0AB